MSGEIREIAVNIAESLFVSLVMSDLSHREAKLKCYDDKS